MLSMGVEGSSPLEECLVVSSTADTPFVSGADSESEAIAVLITSENYRQHSIATPFEHFKYSACENLESSRDQGHAHSRGRARGQSAGVECLKLPEKLLRSST